MESGHKAKMIVSIIGCLIVGFVAFLLKEPSALWALFLIYIIVGIVGEKK